jgi:hypothetical protein
MTPQVGLSVVCPLLPGHLDQVRALLNDIGARPADNEVLPFGRASGVHFGRLLVLDETTDPGGSPLPAQLLLMADLDGTLDAGLAGLVEAAGAGLDALLGHCEGYSADASAASRLAFLRERSIASDAFYTNTIGRTVGQVRDEARLRDEIEAHLDGCPELRALPPREIRDAIREHVRARPDLAWATEPAVERDLGWRLRRLVWLGALPLLVLVMAVALLPLTLAALAAFVIVLRLHELRDPVTRDRPTPEHLRDLAAIEDHGPQNQFSAVGFVKPGLFRRYTARLVLFLTDYGAHHLFAHANLAGVRTIHFARWVALDGRRRMIFASSYDGSVESYMDDFIDKVWWGLNATFSNGMGYPRTDFLLFHGSRDELTFKHFLRVHQVPTPVWYSAYDRLTCLNVERNARIRAGLHGSMGAAEAARWLALL